MSEAIYEALRAIQSDLSQVEVLAQGVANANTAGFRSANVSPRPFEVGVVARTSALPLIAINQQGGSLTATGRTLDIAVTGNAYLQVEGDSDDTALLVKGGSLHLDADGILRTGTGRAVLMDGGRMQLDSANVIVNNRGEVLADGELIGNLSIVEPLEPESLFAAGEGVYGISAELLDVAPQNVTVMQGYLEQSNVNSSESIIRMMELSKHVESVQRSLVALDELLDSSINDLGRR